MSRGARGLAHGVRQLVDLGDRRVAGRAPLSPGGLRTLQKLGSWKTRWKGVH